MYVYGYDKKGNIKQRKYLPDCNQGLNACGIFLATYIKAKSGQGTKKRKSEKVGSEKEEPPQFCYRLKPLARKPIHETESDLCCDECERQRLDRDCREFQALKSSLEKSGITQDMRSFLPNHREWKDVDPAKDYEIIAMLAALRAFHRTYGDNEEQTMNLAKKSLAYIRCKAARKGKGQKRKRRWHQVVAPPRKCRACSCNGKECSMEQSNTQKSVFGHHSRQHRFSK